MKRRDGLTSIMREIRLLCGARMARSETTRINSGRGWSRTTSHSDGLSSSRPLRNLCSRKRSSTSPRFTAGCFAKSNGPSPIPRSFIQWNRKVIHASKNFPRINLFFFSLGVTIYIYKPNHKF